MSRTIKTKTITAENQFTDALWVGNDAYFNVSISSPSSVDATVTVQRLFVDIDEWKDVQSYTSATETYGFEPTGAKYRIGVKIGDFTANDIDVRISA